MLGYKKRTTKARTHHPISPFEHYTVFIALVVSMITTFLLGILLTEVLFGSGLNYFAEMKRQASLQRVYAAPRAVTIPKKTPVDSPIFDRACCENPTGCYNDCLDAYGASSFCQKGCENMKNSGLTAKCITRCSDSLGACMNSVNIDITRCTPALEMDVIGPVSE